MTPNSPKATGREAMTNWRGGSGPLDSEIRWPKAHDIKWSNSPPTPTNPPVVSNEGYRPCGMQTGSCGVEETANVGHLAQGDSRVRIQLSRAAAGDRSGRKKGRTEEEHPGRECLTDGPRQNPAKTETPTLLRQKATKPETCEAAKKAPGQVPSAAAAELPH